jgi:hypothetical protein
MGQTFEFQLPQETRNVIDAILALGAPEAKRKYFVNIGVGELIHKEKVRSPTPG